MCKDIKTVTVIGANGTLGKEVSGIFASFGNATVYMVARNIDKAEQARKSAALSVKAMSVEENLISKTYEDLETCIKKSDLVFESIVEDFEIKKEIHELINKYVKPESVIATGTSGLSINKLANCYSEENKKNFVGMHFFNPPYSLTLCELIPSIYNKEDRNFVEYIKRYLSDKLKRDVIEVSDNPAFLANRIGFKFMNEALQLAEKYKNRGGIDYIDSILGCYTGRNMPPIETIDFVGLDVHKAIVDNIYEKISTPDREFFRLPKYIEELIRQGKLGKKVGEGLLKKDDDNNILVYDLQTNQYRKKNEYNFNFKKRVMEFFKQGDYRKGIETIINDTTEESKICMRFLLNYIIYSLEISNDVSKEIMDCDVTMANGFNWIPPCSLIEAFGGKEEVIKLCSMFLSKSKDYAEILKNVRTSHFDYRKFLKAKK